MKKFRIRLLKRLNEEEAIEYTGNSRITSIKCEVDVEADNLYQAVMLAEQKYRDDNCIVDRENCTLILDPIIFGI